METRFPSFTVTEAAVDAIASLGGAVLVDLEDGGCCGTAYAYRLVDADSPAPADSERYGCDGAWLHVSPAADTVLEGATLDYGVRLKPPRFRVVRNPNTPETCSCRRSFGAPWPGPGQPGCRSYMPMPWDTDYEPPAAWRRQTGYRRPD